MTEDPKDVEIRLLREQLANLYALIPSLASQAQTAPVQKSRTPGWIALPSGQCIPAALAFDGPAACPEFRWDGNVPVFPAHWPKVAPTRPE